MTVATILLELLEETLPHQNEKIEVAEVAKNEEEERNRQVHQGQDPEVESDENLVFQVEELGKVVIEGQTQVEEEIRSQSPNQAQKAMIEVKAAQEGQKDLVLDLRRENIRKSDVEAKVSYFNDNDTIPPV